MITGKRKQAPTHHTTRQTLYRLFWMVNEYAFAIAAYIQPGSEKKADFRSTSIHSKSLRHPIPVLPH